MPTQQTSHYYGWKYTKDHNIKKHVCIVIMWGLLGTVVAGIATLCIFDYIHQTRDLNEYLAQISAQHKSVPPDMYTPYEISLFCAMKQDPNNTTVKWMIINGNVYGTLFIKKYDCTCGNMACKG